MCYLKLISLRSFVTASIGNSYEETMHQRLLQQYNNFAKEQDRKLTSEIASYHICKRSSDRRHAKSKSAIFLDNTKEKIHSSKMIKAGQHLCEAILNPVLESPKEREEGTPLRIRGAGDGSL